MATASYVATLRGINVGGKHSLPMAQLSKLFHDAECSDVQTYIQSGNVVFKAAPKNALTVGARVEKAIVKTCGFEAPVIIRSADALQKVVRDNPYLKSGKPETALHLAFLSGTPTAQQIESLDAARSKGDEFIVRGSEIYLFLPNGVGRSKLTNAYFDSKLGTVSTVRNWRTVTQLLTMATA